MLCAYLDQCVMDAAAEQLEGKDIYHEDAWYDREAAKGIYDDVLWNLRGGREGMSGYQDNTPDTRAEWDEWLDSDPAYQEWSQTVELENRQEDERNRESTETDSWRVVNRIP